jgi:hypothetical protein
MDDHHCWSDTPRPKPRAVPRVAPGIKVVPVEPTEEMLAAGGISVEAYKGMLAAAPKLEP